MKDSKKYFHPETIKRISRLEIRSKYIVEGFLSGMHRSPFFGQSIEFRQHRDYVYGDDLRHVDWKVWARQDRLYVKQFEEDTNLNCYLLVDVSESMSYGSGHFSKLDYAATVACCIAYLIVRQKDSVGCALFDSEIRSFVQCRSKSSQLESISQLFQVAETTEKTSVSAVLQSFASSLDKKGLVVILSDFFDDPQELATGLQHLRSRGHDVLLMHVLDPDEVEFPFDGPTRFEGLEIDSELKCNPNALRETYQDAMTEFCHQLRKTCAQTASDYEFCRTDEAFNTVLASLLNRRQSKRKV